MDLLASLSVSSDAPEGAEHPRLAGYKNLGKVEENQRQRRSDDMQRRNQSRDDWVMRGRLIEEDENMEELNPEQINPFAPRPRRKCHFKNMLMFSDWLVDIPETMSSEWTLMAAPVGRRCLDIFLSNLKVLCLVEDLFNDLDCICESKKVTKNSKFYVLDLLWWNNKMYTDSDFTMRQFFMRSKIEELNIENKNANKANQFIPLPTCPCLPEAMAEFMKTKFPYELDGLLFYFNSGFYISEQTPLVGWLKPWMLPEILGVPIPEYLQRNQHSQDFIQDYNRTFGHLTSTQIKEEKERKRQEDEKKRQKKAEEKKKQKEEKKKKWEEERNKNNSDKVLEENMDLEEDNNEIKMAENAKIDNDDI
uniref:Snurportin-1 n=1 Tax=Meloidogyne enterolobii TaxID=390850 RepID=A0A6V7U7G9_MELEN|nr:unnamed protein product [Meloidogyne enterolobii]